MTPRATYRVQLQPAFGYAATADVIDYLARLGISHLYTSPDFEAAPGSTHGYDVVDPTRPSAALGGEEGERRLHERLAEHGLRRLVDVVPNHLAARAENPFWWDVLRRGRSSRYARLFDVDWDPPGVDERDRILLPVLGDDADTVVEQGELRLGRRGDELVVRYHDQVFPVSPESEGLFDAAPEAAAGPDAALEAMSRDPDRLRALLDRQHYLLAHWRVGQDVHGYRRFFDIDGLIGVRVEDDAVFDVTHARIVRLCTDPVVDGVRVDHPDGLRDPEGYLRRLVFVAGEPWITVEKILHPGERLRASWPVAGTVGYEFLNLSGGLLVDPAGEEPLTALYARFTGEPTDFEAVARAKKVQVAEELLGAEVGRLAALLERVCERRLDAPVPDERTLRDVIVQLAAGLPVYRTYVRVDGGRAIVDPEDERRIDVAVAAARAAAPAIDLELLHVTAQALRLCWTDGPEAELALRFQQLTGPVAAKGIEDTALYVFHRFIAANEVGGDPARFAVTVDAFHAEMARAAEVHPGGLLATSTHDTKRSQDVRMRLAVLSEVPDRWARAVDRLAERAERHRTGDLPDRNLELLLHQTVVGAWPIGRERLCTYLEKAAREAKVHTSWLDPDARYEAAVRRLAEGLLADAAYVEEVERIVEVVQGPGRINSLAQTLLALTAPGVFDLYQGNELWDLRLVDPDNRGPVDFAARRRLLAEVEDASPEDVLARMDEGAPKLFTIRRALAARAARPEAFGEGASYRPLRAAGDAAGRVVAFVRGAAAATVVPRLSARRDGFGETNVALPDGTWRDVFSGDALRGGDVPVSDLLARFPVALLLRERARRAS